MTHPTNHPTTRTTTNPSRCPTGHGRLHLWAAMHNEEIVARVLTAVTFIAMIAGLILQNRGEGEGIGAWAWGAYAIAYLAGGYFGVQAGWASLRQWRIDVDLLMILAAVGAALVGAPFEGALLLFLFSLSNVLQDYALGRTRRAIQSLMALRPLTAQVRRGTAVREIPLEEITIGDILLIRPGEQIGLDGVVVAGQSSVNQAAITGESIPVTKQVGDGVLAGSLNERGALEVEVGRLAADSTLARLIKLVEEAQNQQAPTERFIDKAEQYYAAGVILMTILAIIIPPLFAIAEPFADTFYRAMTLMVAASPCALVISTPATVLSAIGNGARRGILFKGGAYVEDAARLKVIAFDKTGTLTTGKPVLTAVLPTAELKEAEVLALAAAVEAKSEHPLAQAILQAAKAQNVAIPEVTDFDSVTGRGARAQLGTTTLYIGSLSFVEGLGVAQTAAHTQAEAWQDGGQTVIALARQTAADAPVQLLALLAIADEVRSNAAEVIRQLRAKGIARIVVLTGDNERVGRNIGAAVGADEVFASLMPEDKLTILKELEAKYGPVAMVGDGVNDAPALAAATIGIAMGAAGSDVALETADVVLMGDDLRHLPYMIGLSHQTRRVLVQNLAFALGVIVVLIGSVLGFGLALPLSVVGHEGSTVLVSLNGLRLLGVSGVGGRWGVKSER